MRVFRLVVCITASIALACSKESSTPRADASDAAPCLVDVPAEALKSPEQSLPDVDGDGRREALFIDEHSGTANQRHRLYLSNHGCWKDAGDLWAEAETIRVLPSEHGGLRMLRAFAKDGCAGAEGVVMDLRWTGSAYEVSRRIRCGCRDTHPNERRDPACP